jgi:Uncharacterized conserved protein
LKASTRLFARIALALFLVAVVAILYLTSARDYLTLDRAKQIIPAFRSLAYGPVLFIALYAVGCVFAVPASIFIIAAGIIWGALFGGVYALAGGVLGAFVSFSVGKFIGAGLLPKLGKHGQRLERELEKAGFRSMLVLRLVPIFPFAVLNYAAGVAGMAAGDFVFATALGTAPSHFIVAYSADAIANGTLTSKGAFVRILIVGVLLAALVLLPLAFRRKVEETVAEDTGEDIATVHQDLTL